MTLQEISTGIKSVEKFIEKQIDITQIKEKLSYPGNHEGCLRVSIGTKEMNSKFLLAIRDFLG